MATHGDVLQGLLDMLTARKDDLARAERRVVAAQETRATIVQDVAAMERTISGYAVPLGLSSI